MKHANIVEVLGYCELPVAMVYEYMAEGDLQKYIESGELAKLSLLNRV